MALGAAAQQLVMREGKQGHGLAISQTSDAKELLVLDPGRTPKRATKENASNWSRIIMEHAGTTMAS